jgi:DMSO/TMAO reductase YedYZ heme-binding membrane subunit/ferredoxin-NADP reductase
MLRSPWIKALLFVVCLLPLGWLAWRAWHEDLTANPIEYITHFTGDWTIRFIVFTLLVTPLRKLLRRPNLLRFRRMLGLFAFFYGSLHFLTWFWLDKYFDLHEITRDVLKRPFITAGFAGLLLMVPLAITSTKGWIRRLGAGRWQRLHRLVYITAIAGVVHYYWLVKSDIRLPVLYGAIVALLLAARLLGLRTGRSQNTRRLRLSSIKRQTGDTVTLRFPLSAAKPLGAKPGQFLTFEWMVDGKILPRSYSISSSPLRGDYVEITVKEQGIVSRFLNRNAKEGLTVEAHGPFGQFCFDERQHQSVVLFAGGSGITPIMSILRYIEEAAPNTEITLFYAVRIEYDVIFEDDLESLQKRLPRFRCVVVASRPGQEWSGPRGHVDPDLIEQHLGRDIGQKFFFLCGPTAFMASIKEILTSLGISSERIRQERFTIGAPASAYPESSTCLVEFKRSGGKYESSSAESLLAIAEKHDIDIPFGCRVGQCGECATRLLEGEVEMEVDEGLEPKLRDQGYRLLCVGRARGHVTVDA